MSVGFIMYEIVDKDSLKYQGINTYCPPRGYNFTLDILLKIKALTPQKVVSVQYTELDIHLNIKVLTPRAKAFNTEFRLDIHLNIKALTPHKSEYDEFQPFITKN